MICNSWATSICTLFTAAFFPCSLAIPWLWWGIFLRVGSCTRAWRLEAGSMPLPLFPPFLPTSRSCSAEAGCPTLPLSPTNWKLHPFLNTSWSWGAGHWEKQQWCGCSSQLTVSSVGHWNTMEATQPVSGWSHIFLAQSMKRLLDAGLTHSERH